jgi:ActR/RegA family two-component response regulator
MVSLPPSAGPFEPNVRVLIVDDDAGTCETFATRLHAAAHDVSTALTGCEGIAAAGTFVFDVGIIDLKLPDVSGLDVLHQFLALQTRASAFVITGFAEVETAVKAIKLGASDFLEKPIDVDALVTAISEVTMQIKPGLLNPQECSRPAIRRWVDLVLRGLSTSDDPRTLEEWASVAHVSRSTLENRCHAAGLLAKPTLDLLRLIRVVQASVTAGCPPEALLDADTRTITRLTSLVHPWPPRNAITLLDTQRILRDRDAMLALKATLARNIPA